MLPVCSPYVIWFSVGCVRCFLQGSWWGDENAEQGHQTTFTSSHSDAEENLQTEFSRDVAPGRERERDLNRSNSFPGLPYMNTHTVHAPPPHTSFQCGHLFTLSYHSYSKAKSVCVILCAMKTLSRWLKEQCKLCSVVIIHEIKVI